MRRFLVAAVTIAFLAGCSTQSENGVVVGGVEGPVAPTVTAASDIDGEVIAWTPSTTIEGAGQPGSAPSETPESWSEYNDATAPVMNIFKEDGTLGLSESDVERGSELIASLESIKNALPFEGPVTTGIISVVKLRDEECANGGNKSPCALVTWVVKSQGKVVSAPFNMMVVKGETKWQISARNACGLLQYFRTPCPIEFPLSRDQVALGATTVPQTRP